MYLNAPENAQKLETASSVARIAAQHYKIDDSKQNIYSSFSLIWFLPQMCQNQDPSPEDFGCSSMFTVKPVPHSLNYPWLALVKRIWQRERVLLWW